MGEDSSLEPQRTGGAEKFWLATCLVVLLTKGTFHLWYLIHGCPFDLSGDEAHYWEWSRRLDWSYYSKGPLVAYLIAAGRSLLAEWSIRVAGSEMLAVRMPAILLSLLTGFGIFTLARNLLGRGRLALYAVLLSFSMPILFAGANLMTIDAPLLCCWAWALVCVERALARDRSLWWALGGVVIALGILAKYTMVLIFPAVGLYILLEPTVCKWIKRSGPYWTMVIGLVGGLAPIIIWNALHGWVSFRHVAGQAGVSDRVLFDAAGILNYILGQSVVNPVWLVVMIWGAIAFRNQYRKSPAIKFLVFTMLAPWVVFLLFSPITKIQPNWPVAALVSGSVFLVWVLQNCSRRLVMGGVVVGLTMILFMYHTSWLMPIFARLARNAPPWEMTPAAKYDPSARLRGWSELGKAVREVLQEQRSLGRDPFILSDYYMDASEIAFYCPENPTVYCAQSAMGNRLCQYDLWRPNPLGDPDAFVGRPCIYIGAIKPELTAGTHEVHAPLPGLRVVREVEYLVQGQRIQYWAIAVCDSFSGFETVNHGKY